MMFRMVAPLRVVELSHPSPSDAICIIELKCVLSRSESVAKHGVAGTSIVCIRELYGRIERQTDRGGVRRISAQLPASNRMAFSGTLPKVRP
jgi:hypothetical protein